MGIANYDVNKRGYNSQIEVRFFTCLQVGETIDGPLQKHLNNSIDSILYFHFSFSNMMLCPKTCSNFKWHMNTNEWNKNKICLIIFVLQFIFFLYTVRCLLWSFIFLLCPYPPYVIQYFQENEIKVSNILLYK